jgi:hypothetical protein
MSDEIKVSELPLASTIRNDDELVINTGLRSGETPETKRVPARIFKNSQLSNAYAAVIESDPLHYFPIDPRRDVKFDEVAQAGQINPLKHSTSFGFYGDRVVFVAAGFNNSFLTDAVVTVGDQISVVVPYLTNSNGIQGSCGNLDTRTGFRQGVGFGVNTPAFGRNYVRYYNEAQSFVTLSAPGNTTGAPHVFVWTFNTTDGHKFYLDGDFIGDDSRTENIRESVGNFRIGHEQVTNSGLNTTGWTGPIWDIAIYDRVLTPTEIQDISDAILGE